MAWLRTSILKLRRCLKGGSNRERRAAESSWANSAVSKSWARTRTPVAWVPMTRARWSDQIPN